jgi:uncharacterized iron-regulated protein|tara:strand:+ start:18043 stop:18429 length:387 start_codon:yes stop_codon:yes gene_type:complete
VPPKKTTPKRSSIQQQLTTSNLKLQAKLIDLIESNKQVAEKIAQSNDKLTKELAKTSADISEMTKFFREAGKYMVAENEDEKLKPLITKISDLVEQNQTIMRGLILIQKFIKASTPQQEAGSKSLFPE